MQHYWGISEILKRLGFTGTSRSTYYRLKEKYSVPGYPRKDPRNPRRVVIYSNEASVRQWELVMEAAYWDKLKERRHEKEERKRVSAKGQGSRPLTSRS
jgi:hypothetical protein